MRHPLSTIALLSAAFMAAAAPVLAAPGGEAGPPPVAGQRHEGPAHWHAPDRFGPPGERGDNRQGPRNPGLDLAAKLSAAETYVGITATQEDAWRAYTSALIAFFDHPLPPPGAGPGDRPAPAGNAQQPPPPPPAPNADKPLPLASERIADRAIDQGEKARTLKAAVEALRSALAPDQLRRLAAAENALRPPPRGPHGPDGWHGEHGPRENAGPRPFPGDMPPPPPEE